MSKTDERRKLLRQAVAIAEQYSAKGMSLTLRQLA
jgi:hypothetical protein